MENSYLLHDKLLSDGFCHLSHRDVSGNQRYSEIAFQQYHKCLLSFAYTFLYILSMSGEVECVRLYGMLVYRSRNEYVEPSVAVILQRRFKSCQRRLSGFCRRLSQFYLQLIVCAVNDIQTSVLYFRDGIYNAEVGLYIHSLTMIRCYFWRSIYNRSTQVEHGRV